ncbi:MAG: dTDP-4-dehydrorhamnose 3,5-epimerase [Acidobacteriota bacterium]|jgi:dTDP-4-dehydrorhamnose 3,5-epimerase
MIFKQTPLPGVVLIEPRVHCDERGFFLETYHRDRYVAGGVGLTFVQDNHSRSVRGTLRGLHAQLERPQGKLIRVIEGEIFDLALDIRRGAATFAQWFGTRLSASNFHQLYIPPGFAHGFYVLEGPAQVEYKCTDFYDASSEIAIQWNDPTLGIQWPLIPGTEPILSPRDAAAPPLQQLIDRLPIS